MKMRKIMDKRGVLGLDTAKSFVLAILTLAVVAFAAIIALSNLNDASVLDAGSYEDNQTTALLNNISDGTVSLFSNAATWFSLLAVVVIILVISIVIVAVNRFGTRV